MTFDRRTFLERTAWAAALTALPAWAQSPTSTIDVRVDTRAVTGALDHIWKECAGSDRAAMTLRESWRKDLERWQAENGLKRVRFHGIFNDELGVYSPTIVSRGKDVPPNFQNVDQVYDGLLERGVSPFVELSFMPKSLASAERKFGFYAANISPPKSVEAWAEFIQTFVKHLIERYGAATVRAWPFEVWNEPNLGFFWSGSQQQYFEMYKATAVAIKSIDAAIKISGPSTSAIQWIPEFLGYCADNNAPLDFVSTHVYAGDNQAKVFGPGTAYPQTDVIPNAMRRAREQIDASSFRGLPLWLTEWSSDSPAMIAHVIAGCLPHCQAMSQWALSGAFEEILVPNFVVKEGHNGWGMMNRGIALPSFNTYKLLHALGTQRLDSEGPVLATRRTDKSVAALVWNLADVNQPPGIPDAVHTRAVNGEAKRVRVQFTGARAGQRAKVRYVDQERGSPFSAWREMGSPQYPKPEQLQVLRQRAEIGQPVLMKLDADRTLAVDLPPEGVALIELA